MKYRTYWLLATAAITLSFINIFKCSLTEQKFGLLISSCYFYLLFATCTTLVFVRMWDLLICELDNFSYFSSTFTIFSGFLFRPHFLFYSFFFTFPITHLMIMFLLFPFMLYFDILLQSHFYVRILCYSVFFFNFRY